MNVFITEAAASDLQAIGDFIAARNPARAISFVRELVEQCERLADMPLRFQLVPRYAHLGIRRRPYGEYLIFYAVQVESIEILHVLNGAQDYASVLFPDD